MNACPASEMKALQGRRLTGQIERVYYNVPSYREKMQRAGLQSW
jgi:phenylacetate-coenzyme A ligase PaaK-like adenylate-forming protein